MKAVIECLLYAKHCAKCFISIVNHNHVRWVCSYLLLTDEKLLISGKSWSLEIGWNWNSVLSHATVLTLNHISILLFTCMYTYTQTSRQISERCLNVNSYLSWNNWWQYCFYFSLLLFSKFYYRNMYYFCSNHNTKKAWS